MSNTQKYPSILTELAHDIGADGTVAYWSTPAFRNPKILTSQPDFSAPRLSDTQSLLKQARQRFIYREETASEAVVLKLFPLSFLGSKLRHPKYAYREFCNTLHAATLGVPVPAAHGFLEKRKFGLVCCSGIIQQSLDGYTDLHAMFKQGDLSYAQVAEHAAPVILDLFNRGANHIDLRDENIMFNPADGDKRVIDWQYARFVAPRAPWLLEYLCAYFIRLAPEAERTFLEQNWLSHIAVLAKLDAADTGFERRTAALMRKRARVKQRFALTPVPF